MEKTGFNIDEVDEINVYFSEDKETNRDVINLYKGFLSKKFIMPDEHITEIFSKCFEYNEYLRFGKCAEKDFKDINQNYNFLFNLRFKAEYNKKYTEYLNKLEPNELIFKPAGLKLVLDIKDVYAILYDAIIKSVFDECMDEEALKSDILEIINHHININKDYNYCDVFFQLLHLSNNIPYCYYIIKNFITKLYEYKKFIKTIPPFLTDFNMMIKHHDSIMKENIMAEIQNMLIEDSIHNSINNIISTNLGDINNYEIQ